jgi:hypothetical protein
VRLVGYCRECRRVRYVRVSAQALALGAALGGVMEGICWECEEAERTTRRRELRAPARARQRGEAH